MATTDPMRTVVKADWRSVTTFKRGYVSGSRARWTLTLDCGHDVERWNPRNTKRLVHPARARCATCGAAPSTTGDRSHDHE